MPSKQRESKEKEDAISFETDKGESYSVEMGKDAPVPAVDKSLLERVVETASKVIRSEFIAEPLIEFDRVLEEGESQSTVKGSTKNLHRALFDLRLIPDKEKMKKD